MEAGAIEKPKQLSRKFGRESKEAKFIHYCELFYFRNNYGFPTPEQAAVALGYSVTEINYFLRNKKVQAALERRGIRWQRAGMVNNGIQNELSPIQLAAALTITNFADGRSTERKLDELGINPVQYQAWLEDKTFRDFINDRATSVTQNIRPEAITEYAKLIRAGDFRAIQHYFEVTGEFKGSQQQDVKHLLQIIVESVQKHVKDPQILAQISADLIGATPVAKTVELEADYGNVLIDNDNT